MNFSDNDYEKLFENFLNDNNLSDKEFTERQWQILNAAIKVFSQNGYGNSRTSEIAKEASVAEGTIFRYYKTKKDLLMGLIIPFATKFMKPLVLESAIKIMESSEDKPIDEVLKELMADRIELVKKNLPLIKTVLVEASYHPELLSVLKEQIISKALPVVEKFISGYVKKNELRNIDSSLILRSIVSIIGGYIFLSSVFPEYFAGEGDKKEINKLTDILLNGIIQK